LLIAIDAIRKNVGENPTPDTKNYIRAGLIKTLRRDGEVKTCLKKLYPN